jgi:hypothetical protein
MIDVGYGSNLEWQWAAEDHLPRATSFQSQYDLIGDRLIDLLNATKRVSQYAPGTTTRTMIYTLRVIVAAVARYAPESHVVQDWSEALIRYLRDDDRKSERTRWGVANAARSILREVARAKRQEFAIRNPFDRYAKKRAPMPRGQEMEEVLRQAKRDVAAYVHRYRKPPAEHLPFIERAKAIAREAGGILPLSTSGPAKKLLKDWRNKTGLPLGFLTGYLYPSAKDLAPFLVLMTHALAANVDSIAYMRRDAITPFVHPAYGECHRLKLEKPRAGDISPYLLRGSGTMAVASLVKFVLEVTAPLVPIAEPEHRAFALLVVAQEKREVSLLLGVRRVNAIRKYLAKRGLSQFQLRSLRGARALDDFSKHRDPFRVRRLLKQRDIAVTLQYLDAEATYDADAALLADVQSAIVAPRKQESAPEPAGLPVQLPSHWCADPLGPEKPRDQSGLCAGIAFPFNDRHFVLDLSPRPVAFLLREYAALSEARNNLPAERFAKMYAARLALIERDALPLIGPELRAAAESILATLPGLPHVD